MDEGYCETNNDLTTLISTLGTVQTQKYSRILTLPTDVRR